MKSKGSKGLWGTNKALLVGWMNHQQAVETLSPRMEQLPMPDERQTSWDKDKASMTTFTSWFLWHRQTPSTCTHSPVEGEDKATKFLTWAMMILATSHRQASQWSSKSLSNYRCLGAWVSGDDRGIFETISGVWGTIWNIGDTIWGIWRQSGVLWQLRCPLFTTMTSCVV